MSTYQHSPTPHVDHVDFWITRRSYETLSWVSISGNRGNFVDGWPCLDSAIAWATDVLVSYYNMPAAEANRLVVAASL
jgi:hypothetical protein